MTTLTPALSCGLADRWPDVAHIPDGPRAIVGRHISRAIFRRAVDRLPLRVLLPDGRQIGGTTDVSDPTLTVRDEGAMMRRIAASGLIGFGESYLAGEWEASDLAAVIAVFAEAVDRLVPGPLQSMRRVFLAAQPRTDRPTTEHSRHNVERHYDLSNDMFATFLDSSMSYSSALFTNPDAARWSDLHAAQRAKTERILDQAGVQSGTRVLEIGTGWGDLAVRAARRGATVHSVTLSQQQLEYARNRVVAEGLDDLVTLELTDYRDVRGTYDAIVSVEMIEAVGLPYLPTYFDRLSSSLAPGGRVVLQAITMPHRRALDTRHTYTWIHKYIFPGGALPSIRMLEEHAAAVGLLLDDDLSMGSSYAATLRLWAERFNEREDRLAAVGFDEIFRRMWSFYLHYSEGGFRAGYLDVHQLSFSREGDS